MSSNQHENIESSNLQQENQSVTYKQLLKFFAPIGVTPLLIASTHTIVNAALARLPLPELSIAIFTVVKSVTNVVKAPDSMARQASVSLIDDRKSFQLVMSFVWTLCAIFVGLLVALSFTPAGEWVLRNIIGLTDPQQIAVAYSGLRIAAFIPISETLRKSLQGITIAMERTKILPVGSGLRMVVICLFLLWAVSTQAVSGIVAATAMWTIGIGIEGVMVAVYLFKRFGSPGNAAEQMPARNQHELRLLDVLKFFAPLAIMMLMTGSLKPLIQSGLARSVSPTVTLAAYGVAWGLMFITSGPVRLLHQCSLVHTDGTDDPNWPTVKRFSIAVGVILSIATLLMGITPAGHWFFRDLVAVSEEVTQIATLTVVAFSVYPVIRAVREMYWGVLMNKRRTSMIGGAKIANIGTVALLLMLLFGPLQAGVVLPAAVVGAIVFTAGELVETIAIWRYAVSKDQDLRRAPAPSYSAAD